MDFAKKQQKKRPAIPVRRSRKLSLILLTLLFLILLFFGGGYLWNEKRWRYIVVHHTASDAGNLEYYRRLHMKEKGWPDIAYHFIINNGTANTAMGEIEVSSLWKERKHNYSTRISYINYFGIAIVLVGNFENHDPPEQQMEALISLINRLSKEYNIPPERVVGHREIQRTACPGRFLNMEAVRQRMR